MDAEGLAAQREDALKEQVSGEARSLAAANGSRGIVPEPEALALIGAPHQPRAKDTIRDADIAGEENEVLLSGRVLFRFDDTAIQPAAEPQLTEAARVLRTTTNSFAEIIGYTDSFGDPSYNEQLALLRAESVVTWLEKQGVFREQLSILGVGAQRALDETGKSPREQRMVEFTVKQPGPEER